MSRRSQSRRRRSYGRRQHEVRERRPDERAETGGMDDGSAAFDADWQGADTADERASFGESFGGYSR